MTNELGTTLQDIEAKAERKREVKYAFSVINLEFMKSQADLNTMLMMGNHTATEHPFIRNNMEKISMHLETIRKYIEEN